jgi:hypothetical protein
MTARPLGAVVGTTPVANMTGLPLFIAASLEDCRSPEQAQALKAQVMALMPAFKADRSMTGEQPIVDAVCEVMGRAWRPGVRWRDQLRRIGRNDLASW